MGSIRKFVPSVLAALLLLDAIACLPLKAIPPPPQTVFGTEMYQIVDGGGLGFVVAADTTWIRRNAVLWSSIEPVEGKYIWSAMAGLETEMKNVSKNGMQLVLIVRSTPEWARKIAGQGPSCGPIRRDKLAAFGNFMQDLVARYSVAPYNVKYWEIWNEPDIAASNFPGDNLYGCWGDPDDSYYGGGYYAEMLKVVYPQIKAADPQSKVLLGGLLLDCDPRLGAGCDTVANSKLPPKFLEGILRNHGGEFFDGVSFHAYDWFLGKPGVYTNTTWQSAWNTTGPSLIAKAEYIQSLLKQYDVSGKFLMNTETAVICDWDGCDNAKFESTKAYYVAQSYASAIALDLKANIWYCVEGWNNSGFIGSALRPLPAYKAFKFARSELADAAWIRNISEFMGVRGYEYRRGDHTIWLVWSLDGNAHTITLTSTPLAAWDSMGIPLSTDTTMIVTINPLYLDWSR